MKKVILITIFVLFSSVSFAEISTDWKWGKVFNSIVLVSGENIAEIVGQNQIDPDTLPHGEDEESEFDSLKPRIIPYGMGTGYFINKFHIVTNYHVIKNFDKLSIYAFNHLLSFGQTAHPFSWLCGIGEALLISHPLRTSPPTIVDHPIYLLFRLSALCQTSEVL